jgi:hypothetical protein
VDSHYDRAIDAVKCDLKPAEEPTPERTVADDDEDDDEPTDAWQKHVAPKEADTDSGEDSDESPDRVADDRRRQNDLDMLMRLQARQHGHSASTDNAGQDNDVHSGTGDANISVARVDSGPDAASGRIESAKVAGFDASFGSERIDEVENEEDDDGADAHSESAVSGVSKLQVSSGAPPSESVGKKKKGLYISPVRVERQARGAL